MKQVTQKTKLQIKIVNFFENRVGHYTLQNKNGLYFFIFWFTRSPINFTSKVCLKVVSLLEINTYLKLDLNKKLCWPLQRYRFSPNGPQASWSLKSSWLAHYGFLAVLRVCKALVLYQLHPNILTEDCFHLKYDRRYIIQSLWDRNLPDKVMQMQILEDDTLDYVLKMSPLQNLA